MAADDAAHFSPHSFRVYLATSLRSAGCSDSEIQALCRWQSLDSLRTYALLDPARYATLLDGSANAKHEARRVRHLPVIDPTGLHPDTDAPAHSDSVWVEVEADSDLE